MNDPSPRQSVLRIGIAGLGFGLDVHVPAFRGIPGVEVIGLLGRDPARAAAVAARTGLPVATDLNTWLEAPFDAVSLALPPDELEPVAAAVIGRGLPVLCEKPLGSDYAAAHSLATRAAHLPNAVDFEFAELATFAALRQVIHGGEIGRIRHVAVIWLMESRAYRSGHWSWKTDAARHGGVVTLMGTHVFFLLEWLFDPVDRLLARLDAKVSARITPSPDATPAEDLAHVIFEHRGGAVSSLLVGNANPGAAIHRWTIVGERGNAILENATASLTDGFTLNVRAADGRVIRQTVEAPTDGDGRVPPFRRLATRFVDAVRSGGRCHPDFTDGARVAALVEAVRRSAKVEMWTRIEARDLAERRGLQDRPGG
jgi:predicted dehydrogenase